MPDSHRFLSTLSVPIEGYIGEKRASGCKFEVGANMLKWFDSFVHGHCSTEMGLTKNDGLNSLL